MNVRFQKMHGTLNDFLVFHDLEGGIRLSEDQVIRLCDRRAGVGADGVIVVRPSEKADFFMDYINSDGSLAEMCGNGIRCLAKYAFDNGLTEKTSLPVETRAGVKVVELVPAANGTIEKVRVDMGPPIFDPARIPVALEGSAVPILDHRIEVDGESFQAAILSMGNPHCVIVVDGEVEHLPEEYGPQIEKHPLFPSKTNVEFIQVTGPDSLIMRVWERGSGETFSCGTGACAAAVAASLKGLVQSEAKVSLKGGDLEIAWKGPENAVIMTGPAESTFTGMVNI